MNKATTNIHVQSVMYFCEKDIRLVQWEPSVYHEVTCEEESKGAENKSGKKGRSGILMICLSQWANPRTLC